MSDHQHAIRYGDRGCYISLEEQDSTPNHFHPNVWHIEQTLMDCIKRLLLENALASTCISFFLLRWSTQAPDWILDTFPRAHTPNKGH